jgi:hypothetical protein
MEQASTQSYGNFAQLAPTWWRIIRQMRLCREAFVDAFRLGRTRKFEDDLVRNGLSLVEKRVSSALDALRRSGAVLNLDAHRKACRHITRSMTTDPGLCEELAALECLPLDRGSARLHLAALDRGIKRELGVLVSALSSDICASESEGRSSCTSVPDSSIGQMAMLCRQFKRDKSRPYPRDY